jgi:uncharacterized protein YutE (UPF0331/DUF86 family)
MKIDEKRIREKIQFIKNNQKKLSELADLNKYEFLSDYRNYDTAKYNLQSAIEAVIDICSHIISRQEMGSPKTNADCFRILADNNIINEDKLLTFIKITKFRNRIVHLYDEVDDEYIYEIIQNNLSDFDYFIEVITKEYF